MSRPQPLYTIGYQKHSLESFVLSLKDAGVQVVVDVRLNPISRKKGFSKKKLAESLASSGISYIHRKECGNPKEFRDIAKNYEECLALYKRHMANQWEKIAKEFKPILQNKRICLLCFETVHDQCHRSVVAKEICQHLAIEDVRHL